MSKELGEYSNFKAFKFLQLNEDGRLLNDAGGVVDDEGINAFLSKKIYVDGKTTDVFVWVHGWKHDDESAEQLARRMFGAIEGIYEKRKDDYPRLADFNPKFVAVHWPSEGSYEEIRDRAHKMTTNGTAEFVLASLLGYLEQQQPAGARSAATGVLKAQGGYYVHCLGHSFGGRFLSEAVAAAAAPTLPSGILRAEEGRFPWTVDNLFVFQMAAPPNVFEKGQLLAALVKDSPVTGPICLTHTEKDTALCKWHKTKEGVKGIGCVGACGPTNYVDTLELRRLDQSYTRRDFKADIVNIDANWLFDSWGLFSGAHSDYWYEESIHLILSLANFARP